jgi:alkanesulfonate monooxygenase SsuD/methylene tetrahydromethanopterin reductase-like flavin-dependent oxidoreductase (luciferase family)
MMDNVVGPVPIGPTTSVMEAYTVLAAAADLTSRVELGPLVTPAGRHAPAMVAKMAAVIDHISGGRFRLGIGVADEDRHFLPWGMEYPRWSVRTRQVRETIEIVRALWREDTVEHVGEIYHLRDAVLEPKPLREGGIPIWVGIVSPRNIELLATAGSLADGVNVFHADDGNLHVIREAVEHAAAEAGRSPAEIGWSRMVGVSLSDAVVDTDRIDAVIEAVARRAGRCAQDMRDFYTNCERWIIGPPEHVAEQLAAQAELGFGEVVLELSFDPDGFLRTGESQREQIEWLATDVLPSVRS